MADPASTTGTSTGTADADVPCARQDQPAALLLVMPLRAAEQHVLVVVGEADLLTAGELRTQLITMIRSEPPSVLVELGALDFCDLQGLDALHDAARAAHEAGVDLTFRGMSAQLSWLHHTFPPRSTVPPPSAPSPCPALRASCEPHHDDATRTRTRPTRPATTRRTPWDPARQSSG